MVGQKTRREEHRSVNLDTVGSKGFLGDGEVHFSNEDERCITFPHDEALAITLHNGGFDVEKILVDTGSSTEILYYSTFKRMCLSENDLKPFSQSLVGFVWDTILPKVYVTLQMIIRDESSPRIVTRAVDFLMVDAPSAFIALLGNPSMVAFKMMISPCYMPI